MSWYRDASETRYLWPHRVAEHVLRMTVSARAIHDGQTVGEWQSNNWQPSGTGIANTNARWDLYVSATLCDEVTMNVSVSVDDIAALLLQILPPGQEPIVSSVILARCSRTRWRTIAAQDFRVGTGDMTVSIPISDVFGEVEVTPMLVLRDEIPFVDSFASRRASLVATGFPVSIWIDEPEDRPGKGLPRKWQAFPAETGEALYKLAFESDGAALTPVLYINSNYPALKAIVDYRGRRQPTAAAREAVFCLMAGEVWMELAAFAADIINQDLEPDDPRSKLAERIAKTLKRKVKRSSADIAAAFGDEDRRADLNVRIQHWLRSAVRHSDLVNAFGDSQPSD